VYRHTHFNHEEQDMNELISTIIEMKKVYLDMTVNLSNLVVRLEKELELHPKQATEELTVLYKEAILDITANKVMSVGFAKVHNKLDPPPHMVTKKIRVPHLVRVK
jgi:hypothetical protein